MEKQKPRRLDELSEESEMFEIQFDRLIASESDESARGQLITEITHWLYTLAGQGRFVPLGSADRRALRSILERWSSRLRDQGYYLEEIYSLADFDPRAGVALTGDCPYPGLEPYTQSRRGSFFGREALVSSCIDHLEQHGNRTLLIVGASGSGKSSLALAGVLPRLVELYDGAWLFAPRLTPGAHPLIELAAAVVQVIGQPEQASEIERGLFAKPGEAWGQLARICQDKTLMLFIDQFEELLTLCRDAGEQSVFAQVLCALSEPTVSSNGFSCRILLTLRTDHLARLESNNVLKQLYMRLVGDDNQRYLSAIGFEDIKRAIKRPADEVGLRFIPAALIDDLASQTAGLSNGLPLLQFALRRLWDMRPRNDAGEPLDLITAEMVQSLPDVERALGMVAEGIFRTFSGLQRRICERLLLELVVLDESFEEPLRRRRDEVELTRVLEARFPTPSEVARVIDDFVAAGLLRRFGERPNSRLEVAHEALLRHWDHIYQLLTGADVKERLHLVKQIGREAADWAGHDQANDYLNLRGERLARAIEYNAEGWLAEAEAMAYVDACRSQEEAEKIKVERMREEKERADRAQLELKALRVHHYMWRLRVSIAAVLVIVVALFWALLREHKESEAAKKASFARELAMATEAELDLNPQRSLLLAIEAAKTFEGRLLPEVESALRSSIRASQVSGLFKSYGKTLIGAAAYTPDGSALALGDSLGGVTLWDLATGRQRKALFAHVDQVESIAFSPDGRKMATGSADGRVVVWDAQTWAPLHVLSGHVDRVTSLAFSRPDGRLLATASDDASVRLWNIATGGPVGSALYGHIGSVRSLAFGRDQRQLVTAGEDGQVIFWDTVQGIILYSFAFGADTLSGIDLSADGSLLAVAAGSKVEVWDTVTRGRRWILDGHTNSVMCIRFSRDHRQIATASYDGTVRVWRLPGDDRDLQQQVEELVRFRPDLTSNSSDFIQALAFSPTGDTVAAGSMRGTITIWSVTGGGELLTLTGYETPVEAVAFSPNGLTITAAGGDNSQVLTWDLSGRREDHAFRDIQGPIKAVAYSQAGAFAIGSGKDVLVTLPDASEPMRLKGHTDVVNDLAFSPNGSRLVSGSHDGTAIVWELPTGKKLRELKGHYDHVIAVAYSSDGKTIATGSKDHTIILWQADTLEPKRALKGHLLGVLDLEFTPDSKRVISSSKDRTVRIWDVATGEQLTVFEGHTDVVNAVAIYGDRLATADDDSIRLWDLRSLAPMRVFPSHSHGARSLAFSPDGRYLAAGAQDGVVRIYIMQGKELIEQANSRIHRGWTPEECRHFLHRNECPQTHYSILDKAYHSFEKFDFDGGERLLREAVSSGIADPEGINSEVDARIGTSLLWGASSILAKPKQWADQFKDQDPAKEAFRFLAAAKVRLHDPIFDPKARWRDLNLYHRFVELGREKARGGQLEESVTAFGSARDKGWVMPSEPQHAASHLHAVQVVSSALKTSLKNQEDIQMQAERIERALVEFPELRPAHRLAADLYMELNDYTRAEKHYLEEANATEKSAEPLAALAWYALRKHEQGEDKDDSYAKRAIEYAERALNRDPGSDQAWLVLGYAEHAFKNSEKAVKAFDRVSPYSEFSVDALNAAASIYFEILNDDFAAYQRLARAVQLTPNNLSVLSNYAEFLLASGRDAQAKLAAARARDYAEAKAYIRAAMSFTMFAADLLSSDRGSALAELDEIDRYANVAAADAKEALARGQPLDQWSYKGIRRSLERRLSADSPEQRTALLAVLTFVETDGHDGTLDDMRRLLGSQPAKEIMLRQ